MKAHRLNPDESTNVSPHNVAQVGADDRAFPTGVNHVVNHPVAGSHPLPETKVGSYIKDVGDAPSVFHGVEPTVTREAVEDEYNRRQKEATFTAGRHHVDDSYNDPVPVFLVSPGTGSNSIRTWSGTNLTVPTDQSVGLTSRNYDQTRVVIYNEDPANSIRIARTANGARYGVMIPPGKDRELFTQEAIYAIATTAVVSVSVLIEYGVNE